MKMITQKLNEAIQLKHAQEPKRTHLSASQWSHCDRAMWMTLRQTTIDAPKPEILRTFAFGHTIEELIVGWLKDAGYKVALQQAKVKNSFGSYIGSIDGVIVIDGEAYLLEIKSSASKYFKQWIKEGAPEKYKAQASIYMHHSDQLSKANNKLKKCLFVVMNKDTSEVHTEVFEYDEGYAAIQTERMENVIMLEDMPPIEESYMCNMCKHKPVCKGEKVAQINCRTCCHVSCVNGEFECKHGSEVCFRHVFHPKLMEALGYEFVGVDNHNEAILYKDMAMAAKGIHVEGKITFNSEEFVSARDTGLLQDEILMMLKDEFNGTIENAKKI
jgi:Holliday junction resolvase-like predicted endonuclease